MHPSDTKLADDFNTLQKVWAVHAPLYRIGVQDLPRHKKEHAPCLSGSTIPDKTGCWCTATFTMQAPTPATCFRWLLLRLVPFLPRRPYGKRLGGLHEHPVSTVAWPTEQCTAYLSPPITPSAVPPGTARGIIAAARRGGSQGTVVISTVLALPPLAAPHNSDRRRNLDTRPLRKDCANLF
jgi:hypothetical protein